MNILRIQTVPPRLIGSYFCGYRNNIHPLLCNTYSRLHSAPVETPSAVKSTRQLIFDKNNDYFASYISLGRSIMAANINIERNRLTYNSCVHKHTDARLRITCD